MFMFYLSSVSPDVDTLTEMLTFFSLLLLLSVFFLVFANIRLGVLKFVITSYTRDSNHSSQALFVLCYIVQLMYHV